MPALSSPLSPLYRAPSGGFTRGATNVVTPESGGAPGAPSCGLTFDIMRVAAGETINATSELESAWVLLRGASELEFAGQRVFVRRETVFEAPPTVLHLGPRTAATVRSVSPDSEWAVVRTENSRSFAPRLFRPEEVKPEYRGAGLVQNACLRNVRLVFDRVARPESNLVVGEVVNYPGRWSSYPPHHHDQPEIYHYRFTHPNGYGHAELGDDVVKI